MHLKSLSIVALYSYGNGIFELLHCSLLRLLHARLILWVKIEGLSNIKYICAMGFSRTGVWYGQEGCCMCAASHLGRNGPAKRGRQNADEISI